MTAWEDAGGGSDIASGRIRPGLRVYAVGDIHGEADLLDRLAAMIAADHDRAQPAEAVTVFLGDYIDRGPGSDLVLDRLAKAAFPTPIVCLRGNHEQMLLDGLAEPPILDTWLYNGGIATARSYQVPAEAFVGPDDLARALQSDIPREHLDFVAATKLSVRIDGYFFCHAGIKPGVALDRQTPEALLWIRAPFHKSRADHGRVIVHGHTPVAKPEFRRNRINIDTGAFKTGVLTCLVLDGAEHSLLRHAWVVRREALEADRSVRSGRSTPANRTLAASPRRVGPRVQPCFGWTTASCGVNRKRRATAP